MFRRLTKRSSASDAELMRLVQEGRTELFDEIVRRYRGPLMRLALSRLGRSDWAEDAVQEAALAAFKWRHTYDSRYGLRTWLWTILINQCRSHLRRQQRRSAEVQAGNEPGSDGPTEAATSPEPPPLVALLAKERSELLDGLLARLTDVQAESLRLRFFAGLKFQEIADAMDCSLATAKNRVKVGLLRLSELLRSSGLTESLLPPDAERTFDSTPRDAAARRAAKPGTSR